MKTKQNPQVLFYQKIGELFYAVAASDKVVKKAEYNALQNMVTKKWKDMDDFEDSFHTDAAYQIEIVFDWFDYEHLDADHCFESFKNYYVDHQSFFTLERKKLIWETADNIASSFSGKNKAELIMLAKIKLLFESSSLK
jgi:hypothetical protein|tara:strand:+ start:1283 stop:1699 length:417 start_codon:yes stop_codon:yes gene_type:complete